MNRNTSTSDSSGVGEWRRRLYGGYPGAPRASFSVWGWVEGGPKAFTGTGPTGETVLKVVRGRAGRGEGGSREGSRVLPAGR